MKAKKENKVYTINTDQEKSRYLKERSAPGAVWQVVLSG